MRHGPAPGPQQVPRIGGFRERHVVLDAVRDEPGIVPRDRQVAVGRGMIPVAEERPHEPRQHRRVIVGIRRAIAGVAQQVTQVAREKMRIDRLALDQARVAE